MLNKGINYVIMAYFGDRRAGCNSYNQNRYFYLDKHINILSSLDCSNISKITIVAAGEEPEICFSLVNILKVDKFLITDKNKKKKKYL